MATNPNIPPERPGLGLEPTTPAGKRPGRSWWPILAALVTAAVIAGLIYWLVAPNHPSKPPATTQIPPQPNGFQVKLTNLKVSTPAQSGAVTITGNVMNQGTVPLAGITMEAIFQNIIGEDLQNVAHPIQPATPNNSPATTFARNPLPPGASRPFEMRVAHPPEGWNHKLPQLRITNVTPEGNSGRAASQP